MKHSETIGVLAKALADAQGEFEAVPKGAANPFFKSSYADLPSVVLAASPILSKHGIAVSQLPDFNGVDDLLTTLIMHESGEWIEAEQRLHLVKSDPQAHGSAQTYGRRYAYSGGLGIVTEADDDGNAATHTQAAPTVHREAPQRPAAASQARDALATAVDPSKISEPQVKLVGVLFGKLNITDRDERLNYVAATIGHPVTSSKDLTKKEASTLIDALNAAVEAPPVAEPDPYEEEPVF